MPRRPGRPRTNLEGKILAEMSAREKQAEQIVAQKINSNTPSIMAFEAACLLLAIEGGAAPATIQHKAIFQKINQYAKKNGPHGKWLRARDFLEEFISAHAPGWNWREDARWGMARATKFYTPNAPDPVLLCALAWEWRKKRVKNPDARHWWENVKALPNDSHDVAYPAGIETCNGDF